MMRPSDSLEVQRWTFNSLDAQGKIAWQDRVCAIHMLASVKLLL